MKRTNYSSSCVLMMSMTSELNAGTKPKQWLWNDRERNIILCSSFLLFLIKSNEYWNCLPAPWKLWFGWIFFCCCWKIALFCTLNSIMFFSSCSFVKSNVNFNDELEPNAFNRINVSMYNMVYNLWRKSYTKISNIQDSSRPISIFRFFNIQSVDWKWSPLNFHVLDVSHNKYDHYSLCYVPIEWIQSN